MRYLSVCSGIEAATVAWHPLGWQAAAYSEIEPFPRAVLAHHYPETPCHGDFTTIGADEYGPIDLLVGGTPCQSFSIAGLRGGLADERGNLALEFLRLADRTRPRWLVWENVPGVLSSEGGRDFGTFLGGLGQLGYGFAYRVLDAQHFGVPQRRRRVFVVGHLGDWRRAAAVLFERHSLSGNFAPRREKGQVAPTVPSRSTGGGGLGTDFDCDGGLIRWPAEIAPTLNAHFGDKMGLENQHINGGCGHFVAHSLRGEGFDASEDGTGRGTPLIAINMQGGKGQAGWVKECSPTLGADSQMHAIAFDTTQITSAANYSNPRPGDACHPLAAGAHPPALAFNWQSGGDCRGLEPMPTVSALTKEQTPAITGSAVRRLTPRECERLQGFPDDYTAVPYRNKPAADGPRYKALGNSMAVPVMAWIGERIERVDHIRASDRIAA